VDLKKIGKKLSGVRTEAGLGNRSARFYSSSVRYDESGRWRIAMELFIPRHRAKRMGLDAIWLGLVGQTLGGMMVLFSQWAGATPGVGWTGQLLVILGTSVLIAGGGKFAQHRRRSWWWGLLGFLNIPGVGLLMLIPRRRVGGGAGFDVMTDAPARRDVWRMEVRVVLEGSAEKMLLHLPRGGSVETATRMLAAAVPELEPKLNAARFLINNQPARRGDELADQDELTISATATQGVDRAYNQ
jgi:hypothetical protein